MKLRVLAALLIASATCRVSSASITCFVHAEPFIDSNTCTRLCPDPGSISSVICRLGGLLSAVGTNSVAPASVQLWNPIRRTIGLITRASKFITIDRRRTAARVLRKAVTRFDRFRKRALSGKSGLAESAMEDIVAEMDAIAADLRALPTS